MNTLTKTKMVNTHTEMVIVTHLCSRIDTLSQMYCSLPLVIVYSYHVCAAYCLELNGWLKMNITETVNTHTHTHTHTNGDALVKQFQ